MAITWKPLICMHASQNSTKPCFNRIHLSLTLTKRQIPPFAETS